MASEEPAVDKKPSNLDPAFFALLTRWEYLMSQRACFVSMIEGKRTVARQQWLYASGRSRPGPRLTKCDGVKNKSKHQSGKAADYWAKTKDGKIYCPGPKSPFWEEFIACAKTAGLVTLEAQGDFDHLEMA